MGRLFGTDGIRGKANVDLKPALAQALGRATVEALVPVGGAVLVGRTRGVRATCWWPPSWPA